MRRTYWGYVHDADGDHRVRQASPERSDHHQPQQQVRERQQDVCDTHDDGVDDAAVEAGHQPTECPDAEADGHRDQAHLKVESGSVEHAAEYVAAEVIGAERVLHGGRQESA
jgi:hypothetical protein